MSFLLGEISRLIARLSYMGICSVALANFQLLFSLLITTACLSNMMISPTFVLVAFGQLIAVQAISSQISLDYATFQGKDDVNTLTTSFLGIPFAEAGRLQNPRLIRPGDVSPGVQDATQ